MLLLCGFILELVFIYTVFCTFNWPPNLYGRKFLFLRFALAFALSEHALYFGKHNSWLREFAFIFIWDRWFIRLILLSSLASKIGDLLLDLILLAIGIISLVFRFKLSKYGLRLLIIGLYVFTCVYFCGDFYLYSAEGDSA